MLSLTNLLLDPCLRTVPLESAQCAVQRLVLFTITLDISLPNLPPVVYCAHPTVWVAFFALLNIIPYYRLSSTVFSGTLSASAGAASFTAAKGVPASHPIWLSRTVSPPPELRRCPPAFCLRPEPCWDGRLRRLPQDRRYP